MHLWVEEVGTTVYVQNKISHSDLGNKTSKEMFIDEKPEVNDLKIFGCPMYIHVPKEKRSKLDPSGKKGIFVGYSEQSKYYRINIPGFLQIEINGYVTIDEDASFTKSRKMLADEDHEEEKEAPKATKVIRPPIRDIEDPI